MNVVPPVPTPARDTKAPDAEAKTTTSPLVIRRSRVVISRQRADVIWN
jgi:hypothetical protein